MSSFSSARALSVYVGLLAWAVLAQGLFPIYNSHADVAALIAAAAPGLAMLAKRRRTKALLVWGMTLSAVALSLRFATRILGLMWWDGRDAIPALCLAYFVSGFLAMLLAASLFSRLGFRSRLVMAALFGFILMLGLGITSSDDMADIRLKYAIGSGSCARRIVERGITMCSGETSNSATLDDQVRTLARAGVFCLPRLQLESLSKRLFSSRFADDAMLVACVLLGPDDRGRTLQKLTPWLLSRRLEFDIERWTALRVSPGKRLLRCERPSQEMLLGIARERAKSGHSADAEAALSPVIFSGDAQLVADALELNRKLYDEILKDYEGGLVSLGRFLAIRPECALNPRVQKTLATMNAEVLRRLSAMAAEHNRARVKALAALRLHFRAKKSGEGGAAAEHLDTVARFGGDDLGNLELGLRLYARARSMDGVAALDVIRAALEVCGGLEPPFLLLASGLDIADVFPELPEIALRRLTAYYERSIFWHEGMTKLARLLHSSGRESEVDELLLSHADRLDVLASSELSEKLRKLLTGP
ncbi:MAG: hypothetical protein JW759_07600 [Candidatus Coatesbacteria bacterium]|nr:hypothetical protein [Candidatus Coatesbacteria bacterium]